MSSELCTTQSSYHLESWIAVIKELCEKLEEARHEKGPIILLEVQKQIEEVWMIHRANEAHTKLPNIFGIVQQLEDNNICDRIDESLFVLLIDIILLSEQNRYKERAIYLLALILNRISLFNDSTILGNSYNSLGYSRKKKVAAKCLPLLMKYFINPENKSTIRRWEQIGILCLELYRGSIGSHEYIDTEQVNFRRQLGRLIIEEDDKLLKIICSQIVMNICKIGARADEFFPKDYERFIYGSFLQATPKNDWYDSFQSYLHYISRQMSTYQGQKDYIFPVKSVVLNPYHSFDGADTLILVLNEISITILIVSLAAKVNQIIEISLQSIGKLSLSIDSENFEPKLIMFDIRFKKGSKDPVLLNGKDIQPINFIFQLPLQEAKNFRNYLTKLFPGLKIVMNTESEKLLGLEERLISYISTHSSICEILVRRSNFVPEEQSPLITRSETIDPYDPYVDKNFDLNSPNQSMKKGDTGKTTLSFVSEVQDGTSRFNERSRVVTRRNLQSKVTKPKAKQPLVFSRRSLGDSHSNYNDSSKKIVEQVPKMKKRNDLPRKKTFEGSLDDSKLIKTLSVSTSKANLYFNIDQNLSTSTKSRGGGIQTENIVENNRQRAAKIKCKATLCRRILNNTNAVAKNTKKTSVQKQNKTKTLKKSRITKGKKLKKRNTKDTSRSMKKVDDESRQISEKPSISLEKSTPDDSKKNFNLCQIIKSPTVLDEESCGSIFDDDFLQQQDATTLGFVVEHTPNRQNLSDCCNENLNIASKLTLKNTSEKSDSSSIQEPLDFKEEPSQFPKYDMILVKGLNFMLDEINDDHISHLKEPTPYETPQNSNPQLTGSDSKKRFFKSEKTDEFQKISPLMNKSLEVCPVGEVPREIITNESDEVPILEDDVVKISCDVSKSHEAEITEQIPQDLCSLKPAVPLAEKGQDFSPSQLNYKTYTTQKLDLGARHSKRKRELSYEIELKKKKKNEILFNLVHDKTESSNSSEVVELDQILLEKDKLKVLGYKQPSNSRILNEKSSELKEKENDENFNFELNELASLERENEKHIFLKHNQARLNTLESDPPHKQQVPNFGSQRMSYKEKLCMLSNSSEKQSNVKRNCSVKFNQTTPQKSLKKIQTESFCLDSDFLSSKKSNLEVYNLSGNKKSQDHSQKLMIPVTPEKLDRKSNAKSNRSMNRDSRGSISMVSTESNFCGIDLKSGSQCAKVTQNGSPISKKDSRLNYCLRLKNELNELQYDQEEVKNGSGEKREHDIQSKLPLPKGLKAGLLLPQKNTTSLFLHETTDDINFTDIDSHEVISQKTMHDPFCTQNPKPQRQNRFTELLQATTAKLPTKMIDGNDVLIPTKSIKSIQPSILREGEANKLDEDSPTKISKRNEKWNLAIRMRYDGVHDSLHRIADDLITRLVKEEDRMKLLVDQYLKNGAKIVNDLSEYRKEDQTLVLKRLMASKIDLLKMENKALATLSNYHNSLKNNSIIKITTSMEKRQQEIQAIVAENRMRST